MTEIDQEDEVLADTIPAELLTMTGADIQWLFASGYGEDQSPSTTAARRR